MLHDGRILVASRKPMLKRLLIIIIFSPFAGFSQSTSQKHSFSEIFQYPDSVTTFYLSCIHDNRNLPDCLYLPPDINILKNLQNIEIYEGGFPSLPDSINKLKHLKSVILYGCRFNYEKQLCKLAGLDSLRHLDIANANLKRLPLCLGALKSLI